MDSSSIICREAAPGEIHAALRLILSTGPRKAPDTLIEEFIEYAPARRIDLKHLLVAATSTGLLWSILPVLSPGRTMLLLAPGCIDNLEQYQAASALTAHAVGRYVAENIQLVQVLLESTDQDAALLYAKHGFVRLAELIYLQLDIRRPSPANPLPEHFSWLNYSSATHPVFARAILDSYQGSLDCPALCGRRDIQDIIAGHRATGQFDPSLWFVLMDQDSPLAVLLLSPIPTCESVELVYLGLVPAARGKGIGDLLLRHAVSTIHARGFHQLTLAVDSLNIPALKLYYRHGLRRVGAKQALMRLFSSNS